MERATGEIFVEMSDVIEILWNEMNEQGKLSLNKSRNNSDNFIWKMDWQRKIHVLLSKRLIQIKRLTQINDHPTTRPTTVSKSTESFFSLISSEILVPTYDIVICENDA